MKKYIIKAIFLTFLLSTNAHAATYYFSTSGSNSTGTGTIGNPYHSLTGLALTINPGDIILLKAGDEWAGSSIAEWALSATCTEANRCTMGRYSTGANPKLAGNAVTSPTWTSAEVSVSADSTADTITLNSHGLSANTILYLNGTMPTGLTANTNYYAVTITTNTFQLSTTSGGAAINFTTNGSGLTIYKGIYYTTGQTQGAIKSVTVDGNDVTNGYSLNRVGTNTGIFNTALPVGTYCRAASAVAGSTCNNVSGTGSNLFVRLSDDTDPTGHSIRIASYTHNSGNGDRGLLRTTSAGDYWDIVDIDVIHSNGIQFSASGYANRTAYLRVFGGGRDGYLRYCNNTGAEDGSYGGDFGSEVSWNSELGRGNGQGITDYCNNNFYIDTVTHHNAMAGFDTLDLGTTTTVSYILVKRMKAYYNGLDYDSGSFDGNIYNDGGNNVAIMDSISYATGVGAGGGANARWGFLSGSERPTTDPADDIYWMNNLSFGNNGLAAELNNPTTSTAEMGEHYIWGNTFSAQIAGGSTDRVLGFSDLPTVDSLISMRENIFIGNTSAAIWNPSTTITDTMMDSDLEIAYRRGGSTSVFRRNGVDMNLATWQSTTGEDASTVIGDPLFTTDSDTVMVATLQGGSPAIDACGTTVRELEADIVSHFSAMFPTTASKRTGRGSTQAAGTLDDPSTSKDCGFHYNYGYVYPANVAPQSLTANVAGSVDVSFTLSDSAFPYNGKIKITLPSGMSWDSGGTTAISNVVGMTGTYTLAVASQVLTITRVGDGYSTMPQAISFTLSNVLNPDAGTSGTYLIETFKSDGTTKIATSSAEYGMAIEGDTFVSPGPVAHVTFSGQTMTCTQVCTFS